MIGPKTSKRTRVRTDGAPGRGPSARNRGFRKLLATGSLTAAMAAACVGCESLVDPGPSGRSERPEAAELVTQAEALREAGNDDAAVLLLLDALEINPTFTAGNLMLGDIARQRGDLRLAERAYGRAASEEPENFDAQYSYADVLAALGRTVEAIRAYLRAVQLRPDEQAARRDLAAAYLELDEARAALPHARRAVELKPNDPAARVSYGAALSLLGEHERAIDEYEVAAELARPTSDLLINWANSLGVLERFEEMSTIAAAAIAAEESAVAYERLGFARFKLNELDRAATHFRNAIELDPRHYPALNGLGIILLNDFLASGREADGLRVQGVSLLRRSLRERPDQPRIADLVSRFERG